MSIFALRINRASLILGGLIVAYSLYFSWYAINRHNSLNSYAADLSLIDQPMWNTTRGPGGFMELTWGDRQQPRLAEHVEPILVPLAALFWLWDDVRILLIAQSVALGLGALPVFWIARSQLALIPRKQTNPSPGETTHENRSSHSEASLAGESPPPQPQGGSFASLGMTWKWLARNEIAGLLFATVYLLSPHLQAANIADFHADPFVVTPLLFAFWYAERGRWGWMWLWAIVAMATKETLPTLTAMLGLWLVVSTPGRKLRAERFRHGLGLTLVSGAWFLIATFLIVAPLARQYFGAKGPIYLVNRYSGGWLQDPARWQYLLGLLAAVGFLPLLAPELLLVGLPVLAANMLSNYPGQYSGEQHYSAPLVAVFIIAAIYGSRRLLAAFQGRRVAGLIFIGLMLWLGGWSLGYQARHGWTPLSSRMERYRIGPAAARLPALKERIPPEAVVSASAAVHPHLAHRRVVYLFPTVEEAEYLLVDVTDIPGVHPNDARTKIRQMLNTDWRLLAADQGLILARRESPPSGFRLPDAFFDFARPRAGPLQPTDLLFAQDRLRLTGYDIHDDPDDGVTFGFYWQALEPLPADLRLWPLVYDDLGRLLYDPTAIPMVAALWYPPAAWSPGEIVRTETLPRLLPEGFHLGLAVGPADQFGRMAQPWRQLTSCRRQGPHLLCGPAQPTLEPLQAVDIQFGPALHLTGYRLEKTAPRAGDSLPLLLRWRAEQTPAADYTVFVHLVGPEGGLAAQSDAFPGWLFARPTSGWLPGQAQLDRHILTLPEDLPPGRYTLLVGLYQARTLERLIRPNGTDSFTVAEIRVRE